MESLNGYLPGVASVVELLDKRLLLILQDGRHLIGTLRTFDQYLNLVLESTMERVMYEDCYCDLPHGLFVVRGDNVIVFGEIDDVQEKNLPLKLVSQEVLREKMSKGQKKTGIEWNIET